MGDFNGDGKSDLVTTDCGDRLEYAARQRQRNVSGQARVWHGEHAHSVTVSDFNGDGLKDLVTADPGDNKVSVLLGNGTTTYYDDYDDSGLQPITGVSLATQADARLGSRPDRRLPGDRQ